MESNIMEKKPTPPHFFQLYSLEDEAVDFVVTLLHMSKQRLGENQSFTGLSEFAHSFKKHHKVHMKKLNIPVSSSGSNFIKNLIERIWKLTPTFMYQLNYVGTTRNETLQYYYFEAIFGQPTENYPIPQVTCSVYFRVADQQVELAEEIRILPTIKFRVEGQHSSNDIRFVLLTMDQILAVMQTKMKLFKRIEEMKMF